MKHSIRTQYAGIFIALMAGTIFISWMITHTFLATFYTMEKKQDLLSVYRKLNETIGALDSDGEGAWERDGTDETVQQESTQEEIGVTAAAGDGEVTGATAGGETTGAVAGGGEGTGSAESRGEGGTDSTAAEDTTESVMFAELDELCFRNNIAIVVVNFDSEALYASRNADRELLSQILGYIFSTLVQSDVNNSGQRQEYFKELQENTPTVTDERSPELDRGKYMEMIGTLKNGYYYVMRTPMESIEISANIANRFLAYVGTVMVIASGILIWIISRRITKPILELTEISKRMIHLDFEAKYQGSGHNETSLLGENINKLSESLETTIQELKTANNELKKDIEKKEKIDEMRKEFLSNVSHELKTPIALIQGYAEGLQEGVSDDPESRAFYCEVIMDEAGKMNTMVQKLLTLNQIEFGNDMIQMERFNVTELIHSYIQSATILTKQNDITLRMEEYPPIYVWGDEFKVEEVFMNYYTNAVHHCSGDKFIDITMTQKDGKVRIGVFNTGEPIPEESMDQLWDKFYKVDKARTREYGGSGIGLSIVKAIMDAHHQQYGVQNYNNGVLFWFELDIVTEETI